MPLFPATPSLRARVLPRFPANVLAGTGISITKNGNVYVFATNLSGVPLTALQNISTDKLLGRDTAGDGPPEIIGVVSGLGFDGLGNLGLTSNQRLDLLTYEITGAPIVANQKAEIVVPYACTLQKVTLIADQNTGGTAAVVDVLRSTFAGYPGSLATLSGAPAGKPTIAIGTSKILLSPLTGWTTAIAAGDVLRFNVDSTSTITRLSINLEVVKT